MERTILKNKIYLYLTEFFAGMSVMAVELGASRLLAPYFSSSQIVWTIIIGTIMIAMALGNLYGGRSADKDPNPDKLYARILVAAIWIAAIPVVGKYIVIAVAGLVIFTVNSNYLVIAGFVTCMIVFVFPLFLLGTVTPSLVKYSVDSLDESGSTVGRLGAYNTIGSIIGTFIPTFVSIPAVGTSISFLIFAGILLILAIIYFMSTKLPIGKIKKVPVSIVLFLICCIFGHDASFAFWQNDLTYEGESIYNYLQVYESPNEVVLSTNVLFGVQSVYRKDGSLTGMYYDYAMAAPLMTKTADLSDMKDKKMLILGMGSGTYATQCRRYLGDMYIEGVEIDGKITELAEEYFELPSDIPVATYDGRAYLNAIPDTFDIIMVDAYQDITIPFQMSSVEFFSLVKSHLNPGGVMVVNMNMRGSSEGSINDYLSDTIASVFSEVYTADVIGSTNRELFASDNPDMLKYLSDNTAKLAATDSFAGEATDTSGANTAALHDMMLKVSDRLIRYNPGDRILTDDKAPVELLGMRVIDEIIRDELNGIDSIDDVMNMM